MNSKYILFFGSMLVGLMFSSCEKNGIGAGCSVSPSGDTIHLAYNEVTPVFTACRNDLQAKLTNINDSRCPMDVVCFWGGTAFVDLELGSGFTVKLEIHKALDTVFKNGRYTMELIDVTPYPRFHNPSTDTPKAVIRIKKQ